MENGFLLTKQQKDQKKKENLEKIQHKIKSKKIQRVSRKMRDQSIRYKTDNTHTSQNIMNCVVNLQKDCVQYISEKNKVTVCKKMEKYHPFLQKNYFHIYRQLCYDDLKDLKLLEQMLKERDNFINPNNNITVEDSSRNIGKMLTEKYCPDLEQKILENQKKE